MKQFAVSFIVDARHLGDVLAGLHPYKVLDLDLKPVVQRGAKGKAGGAVAWQVVADFVQNAKGPVQAKDASAALVAAGYNKSGISTHLAKAVEKKLIRKTKDGYMGVEK